MVDEDIYDFLKIVAINKEFDYKSFIEAPSAVPNAAPVATETAAVEAE
jgi:hypothetical protein